MSIQQMMLFAPIDSADNPTIMMFILA